MPLSTGKEFQSEDKKNEGKPTESDDKGSQGKGLTSGRYPGRQLGNMVRLGGAEIIWEVPRGAIRESGRLRTIDTDIKRHFLRNT